MDGILNEHVDAVDVSGARMCAENAVHNVRLMFSLHGRQSSKTPNATGCPQD
jgi:hypothetical protein